MNRPTPDPSQEGSRHRSASFLFPSWEGLGVGSWSQCVRESERRLSMNRNVGQASCLPGERASASPTTGLQSASPPGAGWTRPP